jgi:hypothetical protein
MTHVAVLLHIEKEFATAVHALSLGNDGMARVCARRAAGVAIQWWCEHSSQQLRSTDAMTLLHFLHNDKSFSEKSRAAAMRLTVKITLQFTSPYPTNPIEDAKIIIAEIEEKILSRT